MSTDGTKTTALAGKKVEVGSNYLVEGVWSGSFRERNFHKADDFFGSGVLVDSCGVWLVPSRAVVDRILFCRHNELYYASNSLPLLLASIGAGLNPEVDHHRASWTILRGIDEYVPTISIAHKHIESVEQRYFDPLLLTRDRVIVAPRPVLPRFRRSVDYFIFLKSKLAGIQRNACHEDRAFPMTALTTTSSGYDSVAVSALVAELGVKSTYTCRRSNSTIGAWLNKAAAIDDGTQIAGILGMAVRYLRGSEKEEGQEEILFLAPTAAESELAFATLLGDLSARDEVPAVLYTGFHGDKVWSTSPGEEYLGTTLIRGDTSGLNLSEARLHAGFINVPVPFLGARAISDLVKISTSDELKHWSIGTGYDRPIPRRIAEDAGIPRGWFGQRKKAIVFHYSFPKNRRLRKKFGCWLKQVTGWSPCRMHVAAAVDHILFLLAASGERLSRLLTRRARHVPTRFLTRRIDLPYQMHLWAVDELRKTYQNIIRREGPRSGMAQ